MTTSASADSTMSRETGSVESFEARARRASSTRALTRAGTDVLDAESVPLPDRSVPSMPRSLSAVSPEPPVDGSVRAPPVTAVGTSPVRS